MERILGEVEDPPSDAAGIPIGYAGIRARSCGGRWIEVESDGAVELEKVTSELEDQLV